MHSLELGSTAHCSDELSSGSARYYSIAACSPRLRCRHSILPRYKIDAV